MDVGGGYRGRKREEKRKKEAVGESDAKSAQKSSDAVETEGEKVSEREKVLVEIRPPE
jgi:hypothetical protein